MACLSNFCPLCGYDLGFPAWNSEKSPSDEICPSCGIQFGYTDIVAANWGDRAKIYKDYRQHWIDHHMKWDGPERKKPVQWSPKNQLKNIGIVY